MKHVILLGLLASPWLGCSSPPDEPDGSAEATASSAIPTPEDPIVCELGTVYPNRPLIDPDAPVYTDLNWSQEKVEAAFADAKERDSTAYWSYAAALKHPDLLECAFCSCGCKSEASHRSAVDCFKDMHGFG